VPVCTMASRTNRGSVDKTISIPDELYKLPARARTHTQRSSIRKWQILTCVNKQVSTTKGTGGDIIILEEAAYVSSGEHSNKSEELRLHSQH